MNRFDKINENLSNLQKLNELPAKYADYKSVLPSQFEYHNIENEEQEKIAKEIGNQKLLIIAIATIAFGASSLLAFITEKTVLAIVILLITAVLLYLLISTITSKPKVAFGKAVWKNWDYAHTNGRMGNNKIYYVSVINDDGPEKLVCSRIQTTKADYDRIEEGTPILVIKKGTVYHASVYDK
ncbi:MAG: hypothetical protein IJ890_05350 [Clostridia bacterium]|nr:hypothetical protein [Clostridia bacterium]